MSKLEEYIKNITLVSSSKKENLTMNSVSIFYTIYGNGSLMDNDKDYDIHSEDIILINTNRKYALTRKSDDFLVVQIDLNYDSIVKTLETVRPYFILNSTIDTSTNHNEVRTTLNQILNEFFGDKKGDFFLTSKINYLIHILLRNYSQSYSMSSSEQNSTESERKKEIADFINQNYSHSITLKEIADKFYITPTYLSRYFKKKFGVSFLDYLNEVRLTNSIEELIYTDITLSKIASKNGFSSLNSFNQIFKRKYGTLPNQYRRGHAEKKKKQVLGTESHIEDNMKKVNEFLEKRNVEETLNTKKSSHLSIDTKKRKYWEKNWNDVINVGDAELLMRSDVQDQILYLCRELEFKYVRIWNVIKLTVYLSSDSKDIRVNFDKLDRILDFLSENNIRPYLEMNNKPNQLFSTNEDILMSGNNRFIFETKEEYESFMKQFVFHIVQRYSTTQVKNWYFEFWQDPNMKITDSTGVYYDYFEVAYNNLKSVSSQIKVGGAGFILGYENHLYKEIFSIWKSKKIFPDFLSFYGYSYITERVDGEIVGKKSLDSKFLSNQISILLETLKTMDIESPEIHISEWNYTISNRNCINDSCAQASYIVKNCIDTIGKVKILAYWHGTDLFSEYYDTNGIVYGDSGLLSKDRIKKPSFYAFKFLSYLKTFFLAKNENCIVTIGESGEIVILCHNQKSFNHKYLRLKEDEVLPEYQNELYEDMTNRDITIELKNLKKGDYVIKKKIINEQYGSVQQLWKQMEYSKDLSKDEIEYIYNSTIPYTERKKVSVKDKLLLNINMEPHEITIIVISKIDKM